MEGVLERLQRRFRGSLDFTTEVRAGGEGISLDFHYCALASIVRGTGEPLGESALCRLFHEYWAGLLGAFTSRTYGLANLQPDRPCVIELQCKS